MEQKLKFLSATGGITVDGKVEYEHVEMIATFKDLSQNDRSQARLFFMMKPMYRSVQRIGDSETTIIADPNILYDFTIHAIDTLLIIDESGDKTGNKFTLQNKTEFMNDTFAVLAFGESFLEAATPFFFDYLMNYGQQVKTAKKPETN
jgi:hypothetical protein